MNDFSVTIPWCHKEVYFDNNFFPRKARLWHFLPAEYFPLNYDLNGCLNLIDNLTVSSFLTVFLYAFHLFLLFLVNPILVVAFQPYMEWIPFKISSLSQIKGVPSIILMIFKLIFLFNNLILTKRSFISGFPCRWSQQELFSNNLEKYYWRSSLQKEVRLANGTVMQIK